MSNTCAIVACDHGLGHIRRCALMAKERAEIGDQVTLFAPRASIERLQRAMPSLAGIAIYDFATRTTPERIRQGLSGSVEWLARLPDLQNFDTVICDNHPEILSLRSDAIISANFFWHDVIYGAAQDYVLYCNNLLAQHSPPVFGCEHFAMYSVRRQPGFVPVAMYKWPELVSSVKANLHQHKTDLLVTGGTTSAIRIVLKEVIAELLKQGPKPYEYVHVDSEMMPIDPPFWMLKADFSVAMYCRIKTAVCRPGLGVITDLLTVGSHIFPIYEPGNAEMAHNSKSLSELSAMHFDCYNDKYLPEHLSRLLLRINQVHD